MKAHMKAIVLFGHGARDSRWAEPFEALKHRLEKLAERNVQIKLAYLELMQPSLPDAIAQCAENGIIEVVIVPVFFGQGAHLRNDFPALVNNCRTQFPQLRISATPAVGQWEGVLDCIANTALEYITAPYLDKQAK
jgi:sirohydrochlorin cobaltochelatase